MADLCDVEIVLGEESDDENGLRVTVKCGRVKDHPGQHFHSNESYDGRWYFTLVWGPL